MINYGYGEFYMEHELLSKTNDKVFKELFTRNKSCMADFLKCVLEIPDDEFDHLEYVDTHTRVESELDGEYILDICVHTKHNVVDVEVQVRRSPVIEQRIVVYLSNMVKDQTANGVKYSDLKKSVSILIAAEHNVKEGKRYFHKYTMRDKEDNSEFTNLLEVDLLELKKLPNEGDGSNLWDWLKFIKTDNEGEMEELANKNPEIKKAYNSLKALSSDEAMRHLAHQREMYIQNEMAINEEKYNQGREEGKAEGIEEGLEKGKQNEKIEIAKNLLSINLPIEQISKATGLSKEEIEKLR